MYVLSPISYVSINTAEITKALVRTFPLPDSNYFNGVWDHWVILQNAGFV